MHEDPNSRIHRPHPFHRENGPVRNHSIPEGEASEGNQKSNMSAQTNIPVASYYPTGYSENSLPMGKYYPSNYERTQKQKKRPMSSSSGEPNSPVALGPPPVPSEAESRRRLQEYQRDMMAQISSRAHELLGPTSHGNKGSPKHKGLAGMKGLPPNSINLGPTVLRRPNSPRLHPLGSPGPVTPMDLETQDGNYFNKGKGGDSATVGKAYHAHTM